MCWTGDSICSSTDRRTTLFQLKLGLARCVRQICVMNYGKCMCNSPKFISLIINSFVCSNNDSIYAYNYISKPLKNSSFVHINIYCTP